MNPRFPLYIVSKGRWESRLTSKALENMGVPYNIIVEEQEFQKYAEVIDKRKILILDKTFQDNYDTCDKLGLHRGKGSGAARNFAWANAIKNGFSHHWVMDDNIDGFGRLNKNLKVKSSDGTIFACMEDFILRYKNIAMAGPNYFMFAPRKSKGIKPFTLNTRIYSCNLICNDIPFRWRGRFNEDTILSLDMLKAGYCTILFNAFLQNKITTLKMKGGNTDTIYRDGTLPKSQMLVDVHPDVARVVNKFGRWHHHVNYKPFQRLALIKNPACITAAGINNYGMELKRISDVNKI